jgi:hypothetical protein
METFLWPGCESTQGETKVAVLVPGAGYKVESPLLSWPAEQLRARAWQVQAIRWTDDDEPGDDPHGFAARAVQQAFAEFPHAEHRLIVAKSFGTFCIPWAEAAQVPAIWLTPILTDDVIRRTLAETSKPDLLIGGSKDKFWATAAPSETTPTFVDILDANHSLEVPNDWRASLAAHVQVFTAIERFLTSRLV